MKYFEKEFNIVVLLGGMLKMIIQAMCWVTSSKVAIFNVKHKSGKIIGLAHPARVPTSTPIYRGKCACGQKISIFEFCLKPYHVSTHLKAHVANC